MEDHKVLGWKIMHVFRGTYLFVKASKRIFGNNVSIFFNAYSTSELFVDDPGKDVAKIPVFLNVTLPGLSCECKRLVFV